MASMYSCLLCGVIIIGWPDSSLGKWASEYRAVYRDDEKVSVSGIALYTDFALWRVPKNPMCRWEDVADEDDFLRLPVMQSEPDNGLHGFVIHDACWNILQRAAGTATISVERLLKVCQSLPSPPWFNGLSWGHDYGKRLEQDLDIFYPWLERFEFVDDEDLYALGVFANPFDHDTIAAIFSEVDKDAQGLAEASRPHHETDSFSRLPWELCEMILALLPMQDVFNLRIASWTFQHTFSSLRFWQSRFEPEGEREYLFEAKNHRIYNHAGALMNLFRLSRRSIASPGLLNRERVWHLAQTLLPIVKEGSSSSNKSCPSVDEDLSAEAWVSIKSTVQRPDPLNYERTYEIPLYPTTDSKITIPPGPVIVSIAMINTGIWDYITGIKIVGVQEEEQSAGYFFEGDTYVFNAAALYGFRVAMGPCGLRALQVVDCNDGDFQWVGRTDGVPISERLVTKSQLSSMRITLDAYKITALAVISETSATENGSDGSANSLRNTAIWYPELPPEDLILNEESFTGMKPLTTGYEPLSWIQFGGDKGSQLPLLQGLLSDFIAGLNGFRFTYEGVEDEMCNPKPVRLGRLENNVVPKASLFTIDGAGGEHICSLSVGIKLDETDEGPDFLRHGVPEYFSITTNRGRVTTLGQLEDDLEVHNMTVAPGTTITGLYGHYDMQYGMVNIGVISEYI